MRKSLVVFLFAAIVIMAPTTAMAGTIWQISGINDTGISADDIELTLADTGSGITDPVAVFPSPLATSPWNETVTFTAPPPTNELDANWAGLPLNPGQAFVADFTLATGLTPSLIGGTWTIAGLPIAPVNPELTTFSSVPEPSTLVLGCLAAAGLAVVAIRRRRRSR